METNQAANSSSTYKPDVADHIRHSKTLVAIVAVLGVTVLALAAALVVNRTEAQPTVAGVQSPLVAAVPAAVPPVSPLALAPVAVPAPVPAVPVAAHKVAVASARPLTYTRAQPAPAVVARSNVCADCGTVETVTAIKRQGRVNGVAVGNTTIGLGTVAGGVLGGLLGHQVGGGNGRTAMAVIGAAGGAYAGNKVEQNMSSVTVYEVRVHMNDGSTRNVEVSSPIAVGTPVTVEGRNLRLINGAG